MGTGLAIAAPGLLMTLIALASGDEIRPVCFWQDDAVDTEGTDVMGPNKVTLPAARRNFAASGSSEARLRALVRPAREDEKPPAPPASV